MEVVVSYETLVSTRLHGVTSKTTIIFMCGISDALAAAIISVLYQQYFLAIF
jgi:hypothetical protein